MWRQLLTKFASYKVPPVMVSTHGSVVPLAMFLYILKGCHVCAWTDTHNIVLESC